MSTNVVAQHNVALSEGPQLLTVSYEDGICNVLHLTLYEEMNYTFNERYLLTTFELQPTRRYPIATNSKPHLSSTMYVDVLSKHVVN